MPWVETKDGGTRWFGPPPETPGKIYILCFGRPRSIKSSDGGPLAPVPGSHYVGITRRADPMKRIKEHGDWCADHLVEIRDGNEHDEERIKLEENCPHCGQSLNYYAEREVLWRAAQRRYARRQTEAGKRGHP